MTIGVVICSPSARQAVHTVDSLTQTATSVIESHIVPNPDRRGLCTIYNQTLSSLTSDITVFSHNDITMRTQNWDHLLTDIFTRFPAVGCVGVAGTTLLDRTGYWANPGFPYLRGQIIQGTKGIGTRHHIFFPDQQPLEPVVAVDGCFFAVRTQLFKHGLKFDENRFEGFHYYDVDISTQIHLTTPYRVVVATPLLIEHASEGTAGAAWDQDRQRFCEKMAGKLPISVKPVTNLTALTEREQAFLS